MACRTFRHGNTTGIVCGSVRKGTVPPCFVLGCGRDGVVQCDCVVSEGNDPVKTCDRFCCRRHSKNLGRNVDHCLEHYLKSKRAP